MSDWSWGTWVGIVLGAASWCTTMFRLTRCTCGRERPWLFYTPHERHACMVIRALLVTSAVPVTVLALERWSAVLCVVLSVACWWRVKRHGEGKRRWPKRLAGLVKVNEHGRLVVE